MVFSLPVGGIFRGCAVIRLLKVFSLKGLSSPDSEIRREIKGTSQKGWRCESRSQFECVIPDLLTSKLNNSKGENQRVCCVAVRVGAATDSHS